MELSPSPRGSGWTIVAGSRTLKPTPMKPPAIPIFRVAFFVSIAALSAPAAPEEASMTQEQQAKLVDFFTDNFSVVKGIVDLYRSSFQQAKPFYDEAGIELPPALLPKEKRDVSKAEGPPKTEVAPAAPTPAPARVYRSPFKESHLETSGPLNGAHLDNHVPMPDVRPTSAPTREDLERRAAYERANIEAYYFYKALREKPAR